jgi:hypothetical protein
LAVDARRVRLMFEAGKLMHVDEVATAPADWAGLAARDQAVIEVGGVGAVPMPVPSIEQEMQDEDVHHVAVTAPHPDGLDDLGMKELRAIAEREGAPTRVSRADQREAIRAHRGSQPID